VVTGLTVEQAVILFGEKKVRRLSSGEKLPLKDKSIDVILSNCVVNLAPNKDAVFNEANRVLKAGGRMFLSDIVLLENITDEQRQDAALIAGCVAGALLKDDYIKKIENYGFEIKVLGEDTKIRKQFYNNLPIVSLKLVAYKK
jgi:ubiquinone/menaquinone biosynthesis C-methylase UbiE